MLCVSVEGQFIPMKKIGERNLTYAALGLKYGYHVDEFDVITDDGYILKIFHIAGDKTKPVLLLPGMIQDVEVFIIRGNKSLAITLANNGYDVWALNPRGIGRSRKHVHLNPDLDPKFWDFSFHENGYYDLPAAIDFVLERTSERQLSAIGYSQGNTVFYVLGSTRPEYNEKIKVMIALAPVCYLHHLKPLTSFLLPLIPIVGNSLRSIGVVELLNDNSLLKRLIQRLCSLKRIGYELCIQGIIFQVGGNHPEELEPEFLPSIFANYPSSMSIKNIEHVSQVALRRKFAQFDYGPEQNLVLYNARAPPKYDLLKVTMKIALFVGGNDGISTIGDTELLRDKLPNVVDYHLFSVEKFNHLDFIWGRNMDKYLFPHILSVLNKCD
ncbi:unnamed protein product [Parnassius apollo]|uniref:Lipase n=1 Tax=Parnassius apollo TaxID=110799 RepID=A0A8S3XSE2_PARAO|nr:unnamed protein product [Parnassius apollo]